ncbi:MAG TPA: type II toxin-antitoxin system HicA family toxin [Tepidisphaeraceae bacterium]|jgi:predicted RNA binding protein YcfA (HicA-like mRNA interferase family)|nr:type II toxin-antitoxin system HicA family toxin [Tepidisphaeraceae bacterium]
MSFQRRKVIRSLVARGFVLYREGGEHTIYRGPAGELCPVPRHREIQRGTARSIAAQAKVPWPQFQREIV